MSEAADVLVVGAGAAGLWAAARAAERGRAVLVLEKTPRAGTKVLASGGTRCNLTTTLGPEAAARLFGPPGARFLRTAFRVLPPWAVRERFDALGVPTREAPLEKVFPASGRARDVRDALLAWARGAGARFLFDAPVAGIESFGGRWVVHAGGARFEARELLLSPGGRSYPRTGTTGDGYRWLERLDLPVVRPVPALVPLTSPAAWVRALAGVDLQDARVRLLDAAGRTVAERRRPIVFTHRGVSGPGAMDVSAGVARAVAEAEAGAAAPAFRLALDLVPDEGPLALRHRWIDAAGEHGARRVASALPRLLGSALPRRLAPALAAQAGVALDLVLGQLSRRDRHALSEAARGLEVPIDGTEGFDAAEVTAGGLDLAAVDAGSMRVRGREGLVVFGELLDLAGPIGGLNFQAAFATAELAARALAPGPGHERERRLR